MSRTNCRMVESLEYRRLLSAGAFVAGSILHVDGNLLSPNTITVDDNGTAITVAIDWTTARGVAKSFSSSFAKSLGFTEVFVRGGLRADTINVGQHSSVAFSLNTRVDGIAGSDLITTGPESDTINGQAGADTINSGNGNDIVRGGLFSDHITVGNGNDKVKGGVLPDTITAGNGNDTVVGSVSADLITVGNGNDLVFGRQGNDTIIAGNGSDSLWGGAGDDSITGGTGADTFGGILGDNVLISNVVPSDTSTVETYEVRKAGQNTIPNFRPGIDKLVIVAREKTNPTI